MANYEFDMQFLDRVKNLVREYPDKFLAHANTGQAGGFAELSAPTGLYSLSYLLTNEPGSVFEQVRLCSRGTGSQPERDCEVYTHTHTDPDWLSNSGLQGNHLVEQMYRSTDRGWTILLAAANNTIESLEALRIIDDSEFVDPNGITLKSLLNARAQQQAARMPIKSA